jgi:ribosomal protein S18 acetylase RimI-like enzyme
MADMAAAADLQAVAYTELYHEPEPILASRVSVAAPFCWGAFEGEDLLAYILSHPWPAGSPPEIGIVLPPPPPTDNWFIHDLAIGPQARGLGLGRALVAAAASAAREAGLTRGDLVAVQGAWRFWEKFGYRSPEVVPEALKAKVAGYGADARYMVVAIDSLQLFAR